MGLHPRIMEKITEHEDWWKLASGTYYSKPSASAFAWPIGLTVLHLQP
jgi:hypothetical protein